MGKKKKADQNLQFKSKSFFTIRGQKTCKRKKGCFEEAKKKYISRALNNCFLKLARKIRLREIPSCIRLRGATCRIAYENKDRKIFQEFTEKRKISKFRIVDKNPAKGAAATKVANQRTCESFKIRRRNAGVSGN